MLSLAFLGGCVVEDSEVSPMHPSQAISRIDNFATDHPSFINGVYSPEVIYLEKPMDTPPSGFDTFYDWFLYGNSLRKPYVQFRVRTDQILEVTFFNEAVVFGRILISSDYNNLIIGPAVEFELEKTSSGGEGATLSHYVLYYSIKPAEDGGLDFTIEHNEQHRSYLFFNHRRNTTWRFRLDPVDDLSLPDQAAVRTVIPFMPRQGESGRGSRH